MDRLIKLVTLFGHILLWMVGAGFGADPPVPADVPVAAITVVDSHGQQVTDEVGFATQIVVGSEKSVHGKLPGSLIWIVEPQLQSWTTPDGLTMVLTTPTKDATISIMQIVGLGDRVAFQKIKIKCGQGGQPPPDPPGPGPNPPPTPTASKLMLSVVEDTANRTPDTAITLNAMETWNGFRVAGHDWRFFDLKTGEQKGKKALADMQKANIPPPALVVTDMDSGKVLGVVPLPKLKDLKSVVAGYEVKP